MPGPDRRVSLDPYGSGDLLLRDAVHPNVLDAVSRAVIETPSGSLRRAVHWGVYGALGVLEEVLGART